MNLLHNVYRSCATASTRIVRRLATSSANSDVSRLAFAIAFVIFCESNAACVPFLLTIFVNIRTSVFDKYICFLTGVNKILLSAFFPLLSPPRNAV